MCQQSQVTLPGKLCCKKDAIKKNTLATFVMAGRYPEFLDIQSLCRCRARADPLAPCCSVERWLGLVAPSRERAVRAGGCRGHQMSSADASDATSSWLNEDFCGSSQVSIVFLELRLRYTLHLQRCLSSLT